MKNLLNLLIILVVLVPSSLMAQNDTQNKEEVRAKEGDKMMIIFNTVKADAKQDYMKFMENLFFPMVRDHKKPMIREQHLKTRWLGPVTQNEDGSWTFVYLMDPLVENGNYQFPPLFEEKFGQEKAKELLEQYSSFLAAPMRVHSLVQLQFWVQTALPVMGWEMLDNYSNVSHSSVIR